MINQILKLALKNPNVLIERLFPEVKGFLTNLFDRHKGKTEDGEVFIFAITRKTIIHADESVDYQYFILPGGLNTQTAAFRQVDMELNGETTNAIPLDMEMLNTMIKGFGRDYQADDDIPELPLPEDAFSDIDLPEDSGDTDVPPLNLDL